MRLTIDDVSATGRTIDAATNAGANQIQRVRFTLKDEQSARAQALRVAARDARVKAETLADALRLTVTGVASVVEIDVPTRPVYEMAMARSGDTATPIVPGAVETHASITLTVNVETSAMSAGARRHVHSP